MFLSTKLLHKELLGFFFLKCYVSGSLLSSLQIYYLLSCFNLFSCTLTTIICLLLSPMYCSSKVITLFLNFLISLFISYFCYLSISTLFYRSYIIKSFYGPSIVFTGTSFKFYLQNFFLMFIYFWERERASRGGAERGDRGSKAGSELSAQSLMWGSNSQTVRSWPEPKSDA